jgi:cytochrome c biogenesis protein CcmG/thiol:disulfide interchange protein DsbE
MSKATYGNPRPHPDEYDDEEYDDGPAEVGLQASGRPEADRGTAAQPLVARRSRTAQGAPAEEPEYDEYDEAVEYEEQPARVVTSPGRAAAIGVSLFLLVAIFAAVIWLLTSRSGGTVPNQPNVPQSTLAGVPTIKGFKQTNEQQAATKGALAPDFEWEEGGNTVSLSSYRGQKPLFINFWGTWCPPCRAEMPEMEAFYARHRNEIEVIGVSMVPRDDPPTVFQFVQQAPYSWKFVHDGTYDVATRYSVMSVPSSYFIDKNGIVKAVHVGAMNGQQMESYLLDVK